MDTVFSQSDRLGLALFGAALIHVVAILGITFSVPKPASETAGNLEITLVESHSDKAPDKPDFLAQANQDGGGDADRARLLSPLPIEDQSAATQGVPLPPQALSRASRKRETPALLAPEQQREKLRAQTAPTGDGNADSDRQKTLAALDHERAQLTAELDRSWEEYQKRPRVIYITARTREYKRAAYDKVFEDKVRRIGNLKYPIEARRENLAGFTRLTVIINRDGTVKKILLRRSSGHKLLDDHAIRSVELAAPFPPIGKALLAQGNEIHITRTWLFNENALRVH